MFKYQYIFPITREVNLLCAYKPYVIGKLIKPDQYILDRSSTEYT